MKIYLSLVLSLPEEKKLDLHECDSLKEMDDFITQFNNHQEIRTSECFAKEIENYLKEKETQSFTKNFKREQDKKGKIMINYLDERRNWRAIPIIYGSSIDKRFLDQEYAYLIFEQFLIANPRELKEISRQKYYLFSQFEIKEINHFSKVNNQQKYEKLIKMIIRRFKNSKDPYFLVRSFMHSYYRFDKGKGLPDEIETEHGIISKINQELIALSNKIDQLKISESISDNEYFNQLVEQQDFDELYNLFSLDKIASNSSNQDLPLGQTYPKVKKKR